MPEQRESEVTYGSPRPEVGTPTSPKPGAHHHPGLRKKSGWFKTTLLSLAALIFGVTVYDDLKKRRELKRLKK